VHTDYRATRTYFVLLVITVYLDGTLVTRTVFRTL